MKYVTVTRLSLAIGILFAALRLLAPLPLELLDLKVLDLRYLVRGALPVSEDVVIVSIDEQSLAQIGRWPWPRARLAELVDRLAEEGAAAIGIDIVFDQPDPSVELNELLAAAAARPEASASELVAALRMQDSNDARLAGALRASKRVVLGHFFELGGAANGRPENETASRLPELSVRTAAGSNVSILSKASILRSNIAALAEAAAGAGHLNFFPDADGGYRRVPLAIRLGHRIAPAFSLETLRRYLGTAPATVHFAQFGVVGLQIGGKNIHVDEAGDLWINYLGPPGTFPHIPAVDALAGRFARDAVAGKIALVGFTAAGFDKVATPFSPVTAGVELHATAIDNMLRGRPLWRPAWVSPVEAAVLVLLGAGLGFLLGWLRGVSGAAMGAAVAATYALGTQYAFTSHGLVLSLVYPLGAILHCTVGVNVFQYVAEQREKRRVRNAFRHYVNPEVVEILAREPERLRLGGERREVTILFADIRDFTALSERLSPETSGELLNECLGTMTGIVFRHHGLLDKYIGDALMALWGAPLEAPDHAARCCRAATDMLAALPVLHERWRSRDWPLLDVVMGINTGEVVVGNFGSAERFNYTAIGDNVNIGSRLQGLNKLYGTRVLISETTRRAVGEEFICREIDRVRLKGRVSPVAIHELLGPSTEDHDGRLQQLSDAFTLTLGAYRSREWERAAAHLEQLAVKYPGDGPVGVYLQRCQILRAEPPGDDWDGVFEATSK